MTRRWILSETNAFLGEEDKINDYFALLQQTAAHEDK